MGHRPQPHLRPAPLVPGVKILEDKPEARLVHLVVTAAKPKMERLEVTRTTGSPGSGHSAWTLDPTTNQYYYHYFYTQQPDLNWRNPEVRKAMYGVMKFWLDKGVAGFRMDAVSRLFEDPDLHDDPYLPGYNAFGDRNIKHQYTDDLPEVHEVFRELRKLADSYPNHPVLIAEADEPTIARP